jgi:hypothetical protein
VEVTNVIRFADAGVTATQFKSALFASVLVVVIMLSVIAFYSYGAYNPRESLTKGGIVLLGAIALVAFTSANYLHYSWLVDSVAIDEKNVHLSFSFPHETKKSFSRTSIERIHYGTPERQNFSCYLRIVFRDQTSYRSANFLVPTMEACRSARTELIAKLGGSVHL